MLAFPCPLAARPWHAGRPDRVECQVVFRISLPATSAATVFGESDRAPAPAAPLSPRSVWRLLREYYRDPLAWVALVVFAVLLAYGGGAVMFWFHAIYLGEGGPAISPWLHWLLDSTAGFIGLTPALAIIMPLAAAVSPGGSARYALTIGTVFAFVTAPGPLLHNALVGRGTWVANHVTALLGNGHPAAGAPHHIPPIVDMSGQVAVGLPTYIAIAGLALIAMRALHEARAVNPATS
jgi:hypothetical protein